MRKQVKGTERDENLGKLRGKDSTQRLSPEGYQETTMDVTKIIKKDVKNIKNL